MYRQVLNIIISTNTSKATTHNSLARILYVCIGIADRRSFLIVVHVSPYIYIVFLVFTLFHCDPKTTGVETRNNSVHLRYCRPKSNLNGNNVIINVITACIFYINRVSDTCCRLTMVLKYFVSFQMDSVDNKRFVSPCVSRILQLVLCRGRVFSSSFPLPVYLLSCPPRSFMENINCTFESQFRSRPLTGRE